jgi:hypothetical protein
MSYRYEPGKDWVLVDWRGVVCCPWHGELAPEQEYTAGKALCGCEFQPAAGGMLRAVPVVVAHEGGHGNGEAVRG